MIVFHQMEHDVAQKPVPTFWHHALTGFPHPSPLRDATFPAPVKDDSASFECDGPEYGRPDLEIDRRDDAETVAWAAGKLTFCSGDGASSS